MSKREKTSYQRQREGEENEPSDTEFDNLSIMLIIFRDWLVKWSFAVIIQIIIIFLIFRPDIASLFRLLSFTNIGITVLLVISSGISGNTAVQSPMLYVDGTGAMDDMRDAKKRAYSFTFPLVVLTHGVFYYVISYLLSLF